MSNKAKINDNLITLEELWQEITQRVNTLAEALGLKELAVEPRDLKSKASNFNTMSLMNKLPMLAGYVQYLPEALAIFKLCGQYLMMAKETQQLMALELIKAGE